MSFKKYVALVFIIILGLVVRSAAVHISDYSILSSILGTENILLDTGTDYKSSTLNAIWSWFSGSIKNVKHYGAKGDGTTDDTTAITNAYAALSTGGVLYFPPGTYKTTSAIVFAGQKHPSIIGLNATLSYGGTATNIDCFTFGDGTHQEILTIIGISFQSNTTMTAGSGVHFRNIIDSFLQNVRFDDQYGTGKFYHGAWFDGVDNTQVNQFRARAQQDAIRVNGGVQGVTGKADLYLDNGKIMRSCVGIHVGGGFGGLKFGSMVQVTGCSTGFLADQTLYAEANREINIHGTIDSSSTLHDGSTFDGIAIDIQDTSGTYMLKSAWLASAGIFVRLGSSFTGELIVDGGKWLGAYNTFGLAGDGLQIGNTAAQVDVSNVRVNYVNGVAFNNTSGGTLTNTRISCRQGSNIASLLNNIAASSSAIPFTSNVRVTGNLQVGSQSGGLVLKSSHSTMAIRDATDAGEGLPTYADNTAALAAGKTAGDMYRTSTGAVMVVY